MVREIGEVELEFIKVELSESSAKYPTICAAKLRMRAPVIAMASGSGSTLANELSCFGREVCLLNSDPVAQKTQRLPAG
jgi:hypothetical protein